MIYQIHHFPAAEKSLTILDSLCYSGRALGSESDSENQGCDHGLIRQDGTDMRHTGWNFFHTCFPELVQAHKSGAEADVNALCAKLQNDLRPYAGKLAHNYPFTSIDLNDLIQEGLIAVMEYLPRYRYICPNCDKRFLRSGAYSDHCHSEYGHHLDPIQDIRSYLSRVIRGYMLNLLRLQFQRKRSPVVFVLKSDLLDSDKSGICEDKVTPSPEALVASKRAIESIRKCLDRERNAKIREFILRILDGSTAREAYVEISDRGLSASSESARVTIYHLKQRTQLFAKYHRALVG